MSGESTTPQGRAPLSALTTTAVTLALTAYLCVRHLLIAFETQSARYVAASAIPPLWLYLVFTTALLGIAAYIVREWLRGAPAGARPYRLGPIALVLVGTIHFLVLPPYRNAPTEQIVAAQLELFRESTDFGEQLPLEPSAYEALINFPPPFLQDGKQLEKWRLLMRTDCTGPVTEAPAGVETGTMILCIASSREEAWITAVGVQGEFVGPPAIVSYRGTPLLVELRKPGELPAAWREFPTDGIKAANEEDVTEAASDSEP